MGTAGNLTTNAHLAALAMEYLAALNATLNTPDADLTPFPRLRRENPLTG